MATDVRRTAARGSRARRTPAVSVVEAKLSLPFLRPGIVERRALVDRLRASSDIPVVSIVAPAGYGKTTLLAQWVAQDDRAAAWLSLDERDDDPSVLLAHLMVAIDRVAALDPDVLRAVATPGPLGAAPRLGAAIRALERPILLALDDIHRVRSTEALDAITLIIDHLPSGSQMALAGRSLEGLPTARLRARGQLEEIDAADLGLTGDEAVSLFREAGVRLSESDVRAIADRAEGWAAALYLATLSARDGRPDTDVEPLTGDGALIADYIRSEVLGALPASDLRFMTRTSVLERMSGPLCDAVTGRRDSAETLERLERASLLLIPLDHRREWYRYHHLLRDLLERELERREPRRRSELLRRAAGWHRRNGMPDSAVEYLLAADDGEQAADLIASLVLPMFRSGRAATLARWFDWFEQRGLMEDHPSLAVLWAWLLTLTGDAAGADRWLSAAERGSEAAPPGDDGRRSRPLAVLLDSIRCRDGVGRMRADAEVALGGIAPDDPWYPTALVALATATWLLGEPAAEALLVEAAEAAVERRVAPAGSVALGYLAVAAIARGEWREAEALVERARALIREAEVEWYTSSILVYALGARIAAHFGEAERARADIVRAQRLRPTVGRAMPWLAVEARLQLVHASVGLLDAAGAKVLLRETREIRRHVADLGILDPQVEALDDLVATAPHLAMGAFALTTAELRVLPYLQTHLSFREIGLRLFVTQNTAKTHAMSIYRKLGASSRSEAVARAHDLGLLDG